MDIATAENQKVTIRIQIRGGVHCRPKRSHSVCAYIFEVIPIYGVSRPCPVQQGDLWIFRWEISESAVSFAVGGIPRAIVFEWPATIVRCMVIMVRPIAYHPS